MQAVDVVFDEAAEAHAKVDGPSRVDERGDVLGEEIVYIICEAQMLLAEFADQTGYFLIRKAG